jgi:hypothetical protein
LEQSLQKFSNSRCKSHNKYVKLTVWPARTNPLRTILLRSKIIMCMLLPLQFPVLPSLVCPEPSMPFKHPCMVHAFFSECLSNHWPGVHCTFSEICTISDAVPLSDQSRNPIRPDTHDSKQGVKKLARPPGCVKYCTFTPKIC